MLEPTEAALTLDAEPQRVKPAVIRSLQKNSAMEVKIEIFQLDARKLSMNLRSMLIDLFIASTRGHRILTHNIHLRH